MFTDDVHVSTASVTASPISPSTSGLHLHLPAAAADNPDDVVVHGAVDEVMVNPEAVARVQALCADVAAAAAALHKLRGVISHAGPSDRNAILVHTERVARAAMSLLVDAATHPDMLCAAWKHGAHGALSGDAPQQPVTRNLFTSASAGTNAAAAAAAGVVRPRAYSAPALRTVLELESHDDDLAEAPPPPVLGYAGASEPLTTHTAHTAHTTPPCDTDGAEDEDRQIDVMRPDDISNVSSSTISDDVKDKEEEQAVLPDDEKEDVQGREPALSAPAVMAPWTGISGAPDRRSHDGVITVTPGGGVAAAPLVIRHAGFVVTVRGRP